MVPPDIHRRRVRWQPAWRVVPTRYPTVYLFDRIADPADFDALYALEALTNERVRDELGDVSLVPPEERLLGPGSGPIMAAFTHLNPAGSRFSDGSYGVFYAARDRETAIAETRHHHGKFMAATREPPTHLPMRLYRVDINATLHDLRAGDLDPAIHSPDSYAASQLIGRRLRAAGSAGVMYQSVRHERGQCAGLFKPRGAQQCLHSAYLLYRWDGSSFSDVYEKLD
ncbi:MAG TPA: RES family NAD+ phosphorylase [Burkholderiaceae bacterium]|nr:RES family NAD+ phosphorylase [Burkholderiaceae bacterium]